MTSVLYHFKNTLPCWPGLRFFPRSWGVGRCGGGGATSTLGQALQAVSLGSGPDVVALWLSLVPARTVASPRGWPLAQLRPRGAGIPVAPVSPPPPGPVFLICK